MQNTLNFYYHFWRDCRKRKMNAWKRWLQESIKIYQKHKTTRSQNYKYYTSCENNKSKFALIPMFKLLSSKEICNLKVFSWTHMFWMKQQQFLVQTVLFITFTITVNILLWFNIFVRCVRFSKIWHCLKAIYVPSSSSTQSSHNFSMVEKPQLVVWLSRYLRTELDIVYD
jgi:hypothetical protein